ncbi:hypothetical protein PSHT_11135, partial [Puccinia striiformis]
YIKKSIDWDKFVPTASRLIESFGVFYNRSTDYRAALKYEELKSQGYRPVKRSKVNHRWWEEERKRGRVQPDHEQRTTPASSRSQNALSTTKITQPPINADISALPQYHIVTRIAHPRLPSDPLPAFIINTRQITNQSEAGILVRTHGNGVVYVNRAGEIRLSILDNVMYM